MIEAAPAVMEGLVRAFLPDYLRIVEPDFAAGLRLDRVVFPETSLDGAGVVAAVPGQAGDERVTVLVLIEPYALTPRESSARIGRCLKTLGLTYGEPVLASLVFLRGGWGVNLEAGPLLKVCGIDLSWIYFTTFGLAEMRAEYYLNRPEPLAWALAALMRPTERSLEEHHRACLERIAAAPLDEERRALLRQGVAAFLGGDAPAPLASGLRIRV